MSRIRRTNVLEKLRENNNAGASTSGASSSSAQSATQRGVQAQPGVRYLYTNVLNKVQRDSQDALPTRQRYNAFDIDNNVWDEVQNYSDAIGNYDWRSKYTYDLLDEEDNRRRSQGLIPSSLEKRYDLDDTLDRALYYEGLPSSKDIADVAEAAQKAALKAAEEQREREAAAESARREASAQATFDRLYRSIYENAPNKYNELEEAIATLDKLEEKALKSPDSEEGRAYYYLADILSAADARQKEENIQNAVLERMSREAVYEYGALDPETYRDILNTDEAAFDERINALNPRRNELAQRLNIVESQIRDINATNTAGDGRERELQLEALTRERAQLMTRMQAANQQVAGIEQQYTDYRMAKREAEISAGLQPYADIPNAADFEQYVQRGEQSQNIGNPKVARVAEFLNDDDPSGGLNAGYYPRAQYTKYLSMTADERGRFYYLLAKDGESAAAQYIEDLDPVLNKRDTEETAAWYKQFAEDAPVVSDIASVLMTPLKAQGAAYALFAGEDADPYSPWLRAGDIQSTIRQTRTEQIGGGVGGFLYNAGMSILDTFVSRGVGGKASLGIMGAGAMADTYQAALERGADPSQALTVGALAAISEAVFEKYSLENWVNLKNAGRGKAVASIFKSMGIEGSEEMFTEIANLISDAVIMGELGETHGKSFGELAGQVGLAFAGGALSGGVFGGVGTAVNRYNARQQAAAEQAAQQAQQQAEAESANDRQMGNAPDAGVLEAEQAAQEAAEQIAAEEVAEVETPERQPVSRPVTPGLNRQATPAALQQAAQRLAESSGKGVNNETMREAAGAINSQLRAIDALAKRYGIEIELRDSIQAIDAEGNVVESALSGHYDPQTRRITIAADATDQAYTFVATHELVHYIKDGGGEGYSTLEATVFEALEAAGEDVEGLIRQQMEEQGYDEFDAREEVVANSVPAILTDEATVRRIVETDRTLGEKIADFFKKFAENLRNIFRSLAKRPNWTQMESISQQADSMERISNAFFDALEETTTAAATEGGGTAKASVKDGSTGAMGLMGYSEHQINNWKNSKRIVLYEGREQFEQFIDDAKNGRNPGKKIYLGAIPQALADRIEAETGVNVNGYNCSISAYEIQKIFKDHGSEAKEAPRGQRAVTDADILNIPEIVSEADSITLSPKEYNGRPVLNFVKDAESNITVTAYVSQKHLDLRVQTMYASARKESLATATDEQASVNTPEATSGTALDKSITESNAPVKASVREGANIKGGEAYVDTAPQSPRDILAGALLTAAQNPQEREKIQTYQRAIRKTNKAQGELEEVKARIKDLSFPAKGGTRGDQAEINALQEQAAELERNISWWDRYILSLEATKPLKDYVQRERARVARQKAKEFRDWKTENRKAREKRELRTLIQSRAKELLNRMTSPTEKSNKYVPEKFQNDVVEVLRTIRFTSDENADAALATRKKNLDEVLIPQARQQYDELVATNAPQEDIEKAFKKLQRYLVETENVRNEATKWRGKLQALLNSIGDVEVDKGEAVQVESDTIQQLRELLDETNNTLTLDEMTVEQLRKLNKIMGALKHSIVEANRITVDGKKRELSEMGQNVITEAQQSGKLGKKRTGLGKLLNWSNIKPVYAFKRMGGTLYKLFNDVMNGQRTYALNMNKAHDYYEKQYNEFHAADWINDKKKLKFTTQRGDTIELSRNEALSLYATYKREAANPDKNARHLSVGGFVFEAEQTREAGEIEVDGKKKKVKKTTFKDATPKPITESDMKTITGWLSKEQMAFADELVNYMSTTLAELGNETSLKQSGFKKFGESYYFPYKSSPDYIARNPGEGMRDNERWRHKGFTKATVAGARNPIVLQNFTDVFGQHVNDMLMYHAMAIPQENLLRVFNWHDKYSEDETSMSVSAALTNAYGPEAVDYIDNFLADLNGGLVTDPRESGVTRQISRFKKGATMASLSVIVQQPSALIRGMALVNLKYFIAGPRKGSYKQAMKYSGTAVIKRMGGFDTGTGKGSAQWITSAPPKGVKNKAREFVSKDSAYRDDVLGAAPQKMDEFAWSCIWEAVKRETAAKMGIKPGDGRYATEEHLQAAGRRFDEVIEHTQVYDSVISRSELMRSQSGLLKMVTAFGAEPTVAYNMFYDAVASRNVKHAGAYIGAVVMSSVVNALLKSFVTAARDDDEEKDYWEKYGDAVKDEILGQPLNRVPFTDIVLDEDEKFRPLSIINPLTMVPVVRDVISMFQGYDVERTDMSLFSDLITAIDNLDSSRKNDYERWRDFAGAIANMTGVPLSNVLRDVEAVARMLGVEIGG